MIETITRAESVQKIQRDASDTSLIRGILASEGEAADGHIVDVAGIEIPADGGVPMMWDHGLTGMTKPVGSWLSFNRDLEAKPGARVIRGSGRLELGGEGEDSAFRRDLAHMISQEHVQRFSVRLSPHPDEAPVLRTELDGDHWAHVDAKEVPNGDPRRYGAFWPRSVLEEASLTSLGADPRAIINRAAATAGLVRSQWQSVYHMLMDRDFSEDAEGILVRNRDGLETRIPVWAFEKLTATANRKLEHALDLVSAEVEVLRSLEPKREPEVPAPEKRTDDASPAGELPAEMIRNFLRDELSQRDERFRSALAGVSAELAGKVT